MDITRKTRLMQCAAIAACCGIVAMVYGQSANCHTTFPICPDEEGWPEEWDDTECTPGGATWQITGPVSGYYYACNNWWDGCGGTSGPAKCNVMVRYTATLYLFYCPTTGQTYSCVVSIGGGTNLKRNCNGEFCDVPGGTTATIPPLYGPPPQDIYGGQWEVLPTPPEIPNT